jgi:hypothetical protein
MSDDFDRFLAAELSPGDRSADRRFVGRVQAAIALEDQFAARRRALLAGLGYQVLALLSVAAGLLWISRARPVGHWFTESPELALATLLTGFAFLGIMLARGSGDGDALSLRIQSIQ